MPEERPTVLIFRKRLLPWSETFVATQGRALHRYRPVFTGYHHEPAGAHYLNGCDRVLLDRHSILPGIGKASLKIFGRLPRSFRTALERAEASLVHAHFGTSINPAGVIAHELDLPLLVTFHGHDIATVPRDPKGAHKRAQALQRFDRAIAVSDFIADRLRASGCPSDRIIVHRIGVDTDRFAPHSEPHVPGRVLFAGRLVAKKGLDHLLRAFHIAQQAVPAAELVIVGDGPLREPMEQLARELCVRARFVGVQTPDEVLRYMRSSALLAAPSIVTARGDAEGLPITIMEAIATGLPVVAFPSGGSGEGVRDGVTGRLLPAGDEGALARAVTELLTDEPLRMRMSAAARQLALTEFSLVRQTRLLEDIYDEVVHDYVGANSGAQRKSVDSERRIRP
jgi:glycosyltransferase involved in cell wall biosynthesis